MTKVVNLVASVGLSLVLSVVAQTTLAQNVSGEISELEIVGHRGAADLAPENTLLAVDKGIENGATIIEIDVYLSSDGHVVVFHDATLERTSNGSGRVEQKSLKELKALRIKGLDGELTELTIPTLDEVLNHIGDRAITLIEVKDGNGRGIEQKIIESIDRTQSRDRIIVQSFDDSILQEFYRLDKTIPLELLYGSAKWADEYLKADNLEKFTDRYKHVTHINMYYKAVTVEVAKLIRDSGKGIRVYTVNKRGLIDEAVLALLTSIITDRPDLWQ